MTIKVCGMRDSDNIRDLIQLPIDYIGFIFYEKSPRFVAAIPEIFNSKALNTIKKVGVFVNADIDFVVNKIRKYDLNAVQLHGKETPQYLSQLKIKNLNLNLNSLKLGNSASELKALTDALAINFSKLNTARYEILIASSKTRELENSLVVDPSKLNMLKNELTINSLKLNTLKNELDINNSKLNAIINELAIDNPLMIEIWKAFSVDEHFDFNDTKPYEQLANKFLFDTKTPQHGGSGQKFNWDLLKKYKGNTPFFLSGGISEADNQGVKNFQHPQFYGLDLNSKFEISPALKDVPILEKFIKSVRFH